MVQALDILVQSHRTRRGFKMDSYDVLKVLNILLCIGGIVRACKRKDMRLIPLIIWLALSAVFYASTFVVQWTGKWANPIGAGLRAWGYTMVFFMIGKADNE